MTRSEFWAAEGEREGRPGSEVRADFYAQLAEEEDRERQQILANPLTFILRCYNKVDGDDPDLEVPMPLEVLEVLDLQHTSGLQETKTSMRARCRCQGDTELVLDAYSMYWGGSMTEPPDYDIGLSIAS